MHRCLFLVFALMCGGAWGVECDNVKKLSVVAKPGAGSSALRHACILDKERAVHLSGRLGASLIRARGYIQVKFLNVAGQTVGVERLGPWMGVFSQQVERSVAVPPTGWRVEVSLLTESRAEAASGTFSVSSLSVSPGVVPSLAPVDEFVSMAGSVSPWRVQAVGADGNTPYRFSIKALDGSLAVDRSGTLSAGEAKVLSADGLEPGYYDAQLELLLPSGKRSSAISGLAVLPAGSPPAEKRFGIDAALNWYGGDEDDQDRSIRLMKLAGVASIRDRMSWSSIEGARGKYLWGRTLEVARRSHEAGLEVVQVFHDSPGWTRGKPGSPGDRQPPTDYLAVVEFGKAVARHLGPYVHSFEYWNEQNSSFFAGFPYEYAAGLKAFASGLKGENEGLRLLVGAASGKPGPFFDAIHRNGAAGFYDVRNQHYYGLSAEILPFYTSEVEALEQAWQVSKRPGWLTEMGASLQRDALGEWRAAELAQAEHLVKTFAGGFAAGYERVFYFFWKELLEAELHTWGILRDDFSPRPAYFSLSLLTRFLQDSEPVAYLNKGDAVSVFFRDSYGAVSAVTWGNAEKGSWLSGATLLDVFGRPVDMAVAEGGNGRVVLARDLGAIPPDVTEISVLGEKVKKMPRLWMEGAVKLNGETVSAGGKNRVELAVADGDHLAISVVAHLSQAPSAKDGLQAVCEAGKNVKVLTPAPTVLGAGSSETVAFTCEFSPHLSAAGTSHARVRLRWKDAEDVLDLDLIPDASVAQFVSSQRLTPVASCPTWIRRHSKNVELNVTPRYVDGGCQSDMKARLLKSGETWVFPALPVQNGLANASGLRVEVKSLPGVSSPPTSMLIQLVERSGGIWLIEPQTDAAGTVYTGLFNLARSAPWAKDPSGKLELDQVAEILIGWGGYGGNAGQAYGYSVGEIELLSLQ